MIIIPKTDIAVVDFLGGDKTVMVANVLIVLRYLRLDVVKLLVQRTRLLGLTFRTVGFYVP